MATRTVNVRLVADVNQYTRSMRRAADNTSKMAGIGAKAGTAMVAAFAVAAAAAAKFDKELSNVRAVTGASAADMGKLRAAALEAGKTTSFTATEAARAEAELARAGVSVANITGGALKGSLALAASGQLDLSESATIAAQTMNTFGLKGKDVSHIADVLSASANKSASDVHGLGMSLRMGGLLAHQTGLSLEDTVGTLSAFADHALIGSDAGTSLKVMLQRLVPQSKEAQGMMDKIGFSAYDASGKFVGLSELAGRMKTSFSKLTPEARNAAMATIFGADAVRSATIMYELGSEGINKYVKSVNDQGAAGRMAAIQTDNLVGDLERLRGAIEVALIEGGSSANGVLRDMTQWITRLVNLYNGLSPELQHAVTLFTGVGGAVALVGAGLLLLLPRIAATRAALVGMGVTATRTRAAMMALGRLGNVVAGLTVVSWTIDKIAQQFEAAPANATKMANSLVDLAQKGKAAGELTRLFGDDLDGFGDAVKRIAHPGGLDRVEDFFGSFDPGTDKGGPGLDKATKKIQALDEALASLVESGSPDVAAEGFARMAREAEAQGTSVEKLRTLLPKYNEGLVGIDTQSKLTAGSQAKLATEAGLTADELQDQTTEAEKLANALKNLNGSAISAAESEISFRDSLKSLSDAVKDNGHSLDVTSDKGRIIKGAFLDAAKAAMENANAVAEQKSSQEAGQKVLEKDIKLLKEQMSALGFSKDAIDKLTGAYLKLPPVAPTKVEAKTGQAMKDLEAVKKKVASTKGRTVTMSALTKEARTALENLGFKIKNTKGKAVTITVPTGTPKAQVATIQAAINNLSGKTLGIGVYTTEHYKKVQDGPHIPGITKNARGNVLSFYADGGMRENHVAQIAKKGSWRVWAEDEAGDEAYIPLASNKRPRSRQIAAETVRRLGGAVQWFADGGIPGFTYAPAGRPVLGGPSDAKQRYDQEIEDLKKAWEDLTKALADARKKTTALGDAERNLARVRKSKPTKKQLEAAQDRVSDARKAKRTADAKVHQEQRDVHAAEAELGLKKGAKAPRTFNLRAYETQLNESVAATQKWRASLARIGQRGGKELAAMLEGMGEEGYALVNSLAGASTKQFNSIVAKLKKTGDFAKATLKDFTQQLGASTKESKQFAADLQKLAAAGFGDLAQALAAQGDASAITLAHEAAGNSKSAAAANAQVGKAQSTLTGEDLANSLTLLSTLRGGPGRGYADLIAAGLDPATIKALVPKMARQIGSLPAANKSTFVRQWVAQGGKAMAAGGILTRPSMVLGGEAGVPEAWIPLNRAPRSKALLARSAASMGYRLVPAGRYGGAGASSAAVAREVSKHIEVNLYGAKQSAAEQAHDIARVISFTG